MTAIGFIGIGNMGWPMAARLRAADHTVTVADTDAARVERFVAEHGAHAATGPRALAERAEIVITMLPTSAIVRRVLADDEDSVLAGLKSASVVIEMSSGQPSVTQMLAERVAELGSAMIDAPVSGGVPRARDGTLAIMAGGDPAVIERAMPVLRAMGGSVVRAGGVGAGQAMKALNNLVSAGGFLIGVEALLIGSRFGLDPGVMVDVLNQSTGMNNSTRRKFRQFVLSRTFDSGFSLDLMAKDLSTALEIGRGTATPTPYAALCREMWTAAAALLGPGQDHTAMAKLSELLAGSELRDSGSH